MRSHKFAGHSSAMTKSLKQQHQRPEGKLIEAAMKRAPKTSGRALAELVGLSEGRVRQIVNGYRSEGGQIIPIIGPADTVARIGQALKLTPADLRAAGRDDAADEMTPLKSIGLHEDGGLWLSNNAGRHAELRRWLDDPDGADADAPPPIGPLSLWDFEQLMRAALVKHQDELRLKDYFIEMFGRKQTSSPLDPDPLAGGDGNADNTGRSTPTSKSRVNETEEEEAARHGRAMSLDQESGPKAGEVG